MPCPSEIVILLNYNYSYWRKWIYMELDYFSRWNGYIGKLGLVYHKRQDMKEREREIENWKL
jgi:hypothetical protein